MSDGAPAYWVSHLDVARRPCEHLGKGLRHAPLRFSATPAELVGLLIAAEEEATEALQDCIAPTGREARSEALEHRLEHIALGAGERDADDREQRDEEGRRPQSRNRSSGHGLRRST